MIEHRNITIPFHMTINGRETITMETGKAVFDQTRCAAHGGVAPVYLPRRQKIDPPVVEECPAITVGPRNATILLVEDEPSILNMIATMLQRQGFAVLSAASPGEAIRAAEMYAGKISLLISDVVMPEMNGPDLVSNLSAFYPDLKLLFMSGYTVDIIARHGVLDEGVNFIEKPFSMKVLTSKICSVLGQHPY